jgi:C4-dicarboxylate-specific signal transduction histidine kinase
MAVVIGTTPRLARHRRGADPLRKPGWQVRTSVADAVREAVEEGVAESQNALVERALLAFLAERRRERLYAAYAEAARDPDFMADMCSVSDAFEATVSDGLVE